MMVKVYLTCIDTSYMKNAGNMDSWNTKEFFDNTRKASFLSMFENFNDKSTKVSDVLKSGKDMIKEEPLFNDIEKIYIAYKNSDVKKYIPNKDKTKQLDLDNEIDRIYLFCPRECIQENESTK